MLKCLVENLSCDSLNFLSVQLNTQKEERSIKSGL